MSNGENDKKVTGKLEAHIETSSRSYAFNSQDVTINQSEGKFYYQAFQLFWDSSDLVQVNISFPETTKAGKYLLNGKSGISMSFRTLSEDALSPYKAVSGEIHIKEDPTASTLKADFHFKGVTPDGKEATVDKGAVSISA